MMNTPAQNQPTEIGELAKLKQKLDSVTLPPDLHDKATTMIDRAALTFKYGGFLSGFDQVASYIDWITALPWEKRSSDNLDTTHAKEILEKNHYGLKEIKERILEYLAVMKLNLTQSAKDPSAANNFMRAPILFFVGLVGTGKTTIAKSIAAAMGRSFVRI